MVYMVNTHFKATGAKTVNPEVKPFLHVDFSCCNIHFFIVYKFMMAAHTTNFCWKGYLGVCVIERETKPVVTIFFLSQDEILWANSSFRPKLTEDSRQCYQT